jgi:hypothetical protein
MKNATTTIVTDLDLIANVSNREIKDLVEGGKAHTDSAPVSDVLTV